MAKTTKPDMVRIDARIPKDLKIRVQKLGLDLGIDFQDLLAEGLKLLLAAKKGN